MFSDSPLEIIERTHESSDESNSEVSDELIITSEPTPNSNINRSGFLVASHYSYFIEIGLSTQSSDEEKDLFGLSKETQYLNHQKTKLNGKLNKVKYKTIIGKLKDELSFAKKEHQTAVNEVFRLNGIIEKLQNHQIELVNRNRKLIENRHSIAIHDFNTVYEKEDEDSFVSRNCE